MSCKGGPTAACSPVQPNYDMWCKSSSGCLHSNADSAMVLPCRLWELAHACTLALDAARRPGCGGAPLQAQGEAQGCALIGRTIVQVVQNVLGAGNDHANAGVALRNTQTRRWIYTM